jgi:hypothetical protein
VLSSGDDEVETCTFDSYGIKHVYCLGVTRNNYVKKAVAIYVGKFWLSIHQASSLIDLLVREMRPYPRRRKTHIQAATTTEKR